MTLNVEFISRVRQKVLIFTQLQSLRENMKNIQVTTACYFHTVK